VSGLICRCGTYNQIREAIAAVKAHDKRSVSKKLVESTR